MFSYFSTYKQFKNAVVSKTAVLQTKLESMRTEKTQAFVMLRTSINALLSICSI